MIIAFKDGNQLNCELENLEMISRIENMKRNINRQKASESIKATWDIEKLRVKYLRPQQTRLNVGNITGII